MKRTKLLPRSKNTFKKDKMKADRLFSLLIRKYGKCELAGLDHIRCGGVLQTMHIITRANFRLRWDTANALCGCAGHHVYYTHHPIEWTEFVKEHFPTQYEYLQDIRNEVWDRDIAEVLAGLEGVENEVGMV